MNQNFEDLDSFIYFDIFSKSDDAVIIFKKDKFIKCNDQTAKLLGLKSAEDLKNINPFEIIPAYQSDGTLSHDKFHKKILECSEKEFIKFEWLYKTISNQELFVEVSLRKHIINDEEFFVAKWRKQNELKKLELEIKNKNILLEQKISYINEINEVFEEQNIDKNKFMDTLFLLNEYKSAIDESSIVSKADKRGIITFVNDKFCEISGYSREELIGKNHNIIRDPSMTKEFFKNLWKTILKKETFRGVVTNKAKDGTPYYVDTTIVPIVDKNDEIVEFIAIRHDITQIYEQERIIKEQYIDPLTQIHNRQKLLKDLEQAIEPKVAVIDINNFSNINDFYGFDTGDIVLQQFTQYLLTFQKTNINIYRITNDVFAVSTCTNFALEDFKTLCTNIVKNLSSYKISVNNQEFHLKATIGLANTMSEISTNILTMAKLALRIAKEENKSFISLDENMHIYKNLQENKNTVKLIKNALLKDKLLVYGQKIVDNITGIAKYETLMRIKLDDGTILSPFKFLEQAKKSKNYLTMTKIMVTKACDYFKDKDIEFSLNLTLEDLKDSDTMDYIFETITKTNTANRITFEIVESEGIEQFEEVNNFIKKAKLLKCKIAIDDFGTGYSNFEYIIKLNVDFIKIDGSLIKNITQDESIKITVQTIVNFAKALNIKTVAEFVHNDEVYQAVKSMGIDYSQGFFLHEPEHLTQK